MKSKYNRGSTIHHAMVRLARHPHDLNDLRKAISNSSTARFREFVVEPLISDGMAEIKDNMLQLTDLGEERLEYLGPIKIPLKSVSAVRGTGTYDGAELKTQVHRPGANDYLKWPSRVGDDYFYRT